MGFTADASAGLEGPDWLARRRSEAWERFESGGLPSESDDLWKYSGIERLDLDSYDPAAPGPVPDRAGLLARSKQLAEPFGEIALLVTTVDGALLSADDDLRAAGAADSVQLHSSGRSPGDDSGGPLTDDIESHVVSSWRDALDDLHTAFVRDVVDLRVAAKASLGAPVVVVNLSSASSGEHRATASFPHLNVSVGSSADVSVVEIFAAAESSGTTRHSGLVLPFTRLNVAENSRLAYATLQVLPEGWVQLGVQSATVARDATLRAFCASLGSSIGRLRADAELDGQGGEISLVAGYLGTGDQLHDLRTLQEHVAPRSRSQLLCMGAVTDTARSAYVGLTRVRNGAHGADAYQTNHNLVLSEGAHADSVPNLDIQENDVRCSHASTVGPIDEDQLYYLESRGIDPATAERLIVLGFFRELSSKSSSDVVRSWFVEEITARLSRSGLGRAGSGSDD